MAGLAGWLAWLAGWLDGSSDRWMLVERREEKREEKKGHRLRHGRAGGTSGVCAPATGGPTVMAERPERQTCVPERVGSASFLASLWGGQTSVGLMGLVGLVGLVGLGGFVATAIVRTRAGRVTAGGMCVPRSAALGHVMHAPARICSDSCQPRRREDACGRTSGAPSSRAPLGCASHTRKSVLSITHADVTTFHSVTCWPPARGRFRLTHPARCHPVDRHRRVTRQGCWGARYASASWSPLAWHRMVCPLTPHKLWQTIWDARSKNGKLGVGRGRAVRITRSARRIPPPGFWGRTRLVFYLD